MARKKRRPRAERRRARKTRRKAKKEPRIRGLLPVLEGRGVCLPLLAILFLLASLLRVHHFKALEYYDPRDGTGLFWTESAFQYRYASMVAEGKRIPAFDPKVQHPRGLSIRENVTVFMEYIDGFLYRMLGGLARRPGGGKLPFHVFLIYAISFTTSLGVFAAYGVAAALWERRWAGLLAGALYAVAVPTYSRIIGAYGREHLALPFIFCSLWALVPALRALSAPSGSTGKPAWMERGLFLVSGLLLALALACWHLSRFYFVVFSAAMVGAWIYLHFTERSGADKLAGLIPWLLVPVLLASFVSPILRGRQFFVFPAFAALWALPLARLVAARCSPRARLGVSFGLLVLLAAAATAVQRGDGEYSHVWALMRAKAQHLGVKPSDPSRLSYEARLLWIEDLRSPHPRLLVYTYGTIPLLALMGAVVGLRRRPWRTWGSHTALLMLLLFAFAALYLLMGRMTGFCVFFLVAMAGGIILGQRRVWLVIALCCLAFEAHKCLYFKQPTAFKRFVDSVFRPEPSPIPNWHPNNIAVINWIRHNTAPDDAFLARFGTSPMVLAYADRPVVLQSKVENRDVRESIRGYLDAIYGTEQDFCRYCADNHVRYFLYEAKIALDCSGDSDRFVADALKLRRDSAACLLHFCPRQLRHFTVVFQDSFYRVFAVHPEGQAPASRPLAYQPTYDIDLFGRQEGAFFGDSATPEVMARLVSAVDLFKRAQALLGAGRVPEAVSDMQAAVELNPGVMGLQTTLGLALGMVGRTDEALRHLREEVRVYPELVLGHYNLGFVLANAGRYDEAMRQWEQGLRYDPTDPAILAGMAQVRAIRRS